jgi:hypothetical protein
MNKAVDDETKKGKFALMFQRAVDRELLEKAKGALAKVGDDASMVVEMSTDLEQAKAKAQLLATKLADARMSLQAARAELDELTGARGVLAAYRRLGDDDKQKLSATLLCDDFGAAAPLLTVEEVHACAKPLASLLSPLETTKRVKVLAELLGGLPASERTSVLYTLATREGVHPNALTALFLPREAEDNADEPPPPTAAAPSSSERRALADALLDDAGGGQMAHVAPELFAAIQERLGGGILGGSPSRRTSLRSSAATESSAAEVERMRAEMAQLQQQLEAQTAHNLDALDGYDSIEELLAAARAEAVTQALAHDGDTASLINRVAELERMLMERESSVQLERADAKALYDEFGNVLAEAVRTFTEP